jgi:ABC-type lipoprotein release transport system permease subunit
MKMLLTIAWRNVWRNRTRSLVVMVALALGLWAGNFMMAYAFGLYDQRLANALEYELAHVQVHHPDFRVEQQPELIVPESAWHTERLESMEGVRAVSGRLVANAMISSSRGAGGVRLLGVDPEAEALVSRIPAAVDTGSFLAEGKKHRIVVGHSLANKLRLNVGSRVVLKFQNASGDFVDARFKVGGIFRSPNSTFDEMMVYVKRSSLEPLLLGGLQEGQGVHELAVMLDDAARAQSFAGGENQAHPELLTEDWKTRSPELELMIDSTDQYFTIFLGIIMLAVAFGVINTMLMAVLDRVREIGVLMALGMNRMKIFVLVVLETVFLMLAAAPMGLFLAWATVAWFGQHGLDLSFMSEAYAMYGLDPIVYTHLDGSYYLRNLILLLITALASAILPAWTALRLDPVEAIRKI